MNVNKCICTGRLTKDPQLRALPSGTSVCELRLAVDSMGRNREVGYINVSVFGKPAEAARSIWARAGWWPSMAVWNTACGRRTGGERRHDYTVAGNVEFLSAPRPADDQAEPAKRARRKSEPVAA